MQPLKLAKVAVDQKEFFVVLSLANRNIKPSNCHNGEVRTVRGPDSNVTGRALVCINRVWSPACGGSSNWNYTNAVVACRQLGLQPHEGNQIKAVANESIISSCS